MSMRAKHEDEDVVLCPSRKFHVRALTSEQAAERFASRALPEPVTFCFGSHSLFIASASALSASYVEKQCPQMRALLPYCETEPCN